MTNPTWLWTCMTTFFLLQGLENSTVWCAAFWMSTFLFDLISRFAPTSVDEANTFDVEDGKTPQHPCGRCANGAGDPEDHHEQHRSLVPSGQQVAGGKSHQHGTWGLQRGDFQQPRWRLVVGDANRDVWGNDTANRHPNNVERKLHEPKVGQTDQPGTTKENGTIHGEPF